jgi:serine/threonine protein kinase
MGKPGSLTGQMLGSKYLLGDLVGKGGFGAVYQAQYVLLNRPQAIKILLEEHFSDPKFHERFVREARTLAALDHPNIVHVDELGMEGDLIYLVMPYLSGGTLQEVLGAQRGPLPLDQVDTYLAQICAALDYVHAQRVVHLDLKPLNLLRHQDGRLLLSDFGLAHLMKEGAVQGSTSLQFGSPEYMAPEHFDGKPEQRSDLYALGVILYQLLAGRVPFTGTSPMALMRQHLTEEPPPLRATRPDLPTTLESVLAKALAKQPEQRYHQAGELLADFRATLGRQGVQPITNPFGVPTRVSQPGLGTTVRAANPPINSNSQSLPPTIQGASSAGPFYQAVQVVPVIPQKQVNELWLAFRYGLLGVGITVLFLVPFFVLLFLVVLLVLGDFLPPIGGNNLIIVLLAILFILPPAIVGFKTTARISRKRTGALAGFFTGLFLGIFWAIGAFVEPADAAKSLFFSFACVLGDPLFGFIGAWLAVRRYH